MPKGTFVARRGFPAVVARSGAWWCRVRRGRCVSAAVAHAAASVQPVACRGDAVDHRCELGVRVLAAGPGPRHRPGQRTALRPRADGRRASPVTSLLAWTGATTWFGLIGWAFAGVGMGLSSSSLSVLTLDLSEPATPAATAAPPRWQARSASPRRWPISGTLLAFNSADPHPWVFGTIITTSAAIAFLGLLTAGRVLGKAPRQVPAHEPIADGARR